MEQFWRYGGLVPGLLGFGLALYFGPSWPSLILMFVAGLNIAGTYWYVTTCEFRDRMQTRFQDLGRVNEDMHQLNREMLAALRAAATPRTVEIVENEPSPRDKFH